MVRNSGRLCHLPLIKVKNSIEKDNDWCTITIDAQYLNDAQYLKDWLRETVDLRSAQNRLDVEEGLENGWRVVWNITCPSYAHLINVYWCDMMCRNQREIKKHRVTHFDEIKIIQDT